MEGKYLTRAEMECIRGSTVCTKSIFTTNLQDNRRRAEEEKARRQAREKREKEAAERRQAQVSIFLTRLAP